MNIKAKIRSLFGLAVLSFLVLASSQSATAVPNPGAIAWAGTNGQFVNSLYVGVLGRAPESTAIVAEWSAQLTSSPTSRWNMFWRFVNSPEYKRYRGSKSGRYSVYYKNTRNGYIYTVAAQNPAGYHHKYGPFSFGVAQALRAYYDTFE